MSAATLMIQGTGSSVGKSLLTAALCAIFAERGYRVSPFKALNMANNAAVTPAGFEIARAQALQAWACGIDPDPSMNPVLLKPEGDRRSQLVLRGRAAGTVTAWSDEGQRAEMRRAVRESLERLRASYDLVLIEGAGSPAEVNLRRWDVANMWVARLHDTPVLLVGDIDRGGVIAALAGTISLLTPHERGLVKGMIVNKFRGDRRLFDDGVAFLERRLRRPVLGVVPFVPRLLLADEDGDGLRTLRRRFSGNAQVRIAVLALPQIANYDELAAFEAEPDVEVAYTADPRAVAAADAIVLPGSKATLRDLREMRRLGLDREIHAAASSGRAVIGICGGYQMLGAHLEDPVGNDGGGSAAGLGLLPASTRFSAEKTVRRSHARVTTAEGLLAGLAGARLRGYEIHAGTTCVQGGVALRSDDGVPLGSLNAGGRVFGSYLHGAFEDDAFRHGVLAAIAGRPLEHPMAYEPRRELVRLVEAVRGALDIAAVAALAGLGEGPGAPRYG